MYIYILYYIYMIKILGFMVEEKSNGEVVEQLQEIQ